MRIDQLGIAQDLDIKFPDGKGGFADSTGIVLKVVGTDSDEFHGVVKRQMQEARGRETALTVDEISRQTSEQLACCIVGWTGIEDVNGEVPYSPEKALEIMETTRLAFIREQVEGFVTKRTNFFRKVENPA